MPTIFWKKIGKGSWMNIGGSETSRKVQIGGGIPLKTHRRRGQRIPALQFLVNETFRTLLPLPHMLMLPEELQQ